MPFKSEAQRRWMYANKPEMAAKWQAHTPKGAKLPEKVKKASMNEALQRLHESATFAQLKKTASSNALATKIAAQVAAEKRAACANHNTAKAVARPKKKGAFKRAMEEMGTPPDVEQKPSPATNGSIFDQGPSPEQQQAAQQAESRKQEVHDLQVQQQAQKNEIELESMRLKLEQDKAEFALKMQELKHRQAEQQMKIEDQQMQQEQHDSDMGPAPEGPMLNDAQYKMNLAGLNSPKQAAYEDRYVHGPEPVPFTGRLAPAGIGAGLGALAGTALAPTDVAADLFHAARKNPANKWNLRAKGLGANWKRTAGGAGAGLLAGLLAHEMLD